MTDDKKPNAIPFPEDEKKEEKLITYKQYYIRFTLIFVDGTTGGGKEVVSMRADSDIRTRDIELYIVSGLAKKGQTNIKDILIDAMFLEKTTELKESEIVKYVKEREKEDKVK